ncbi:MAG: orotidine-5'-phosphate decarboxylase [Pirellulaceae bacterium]
MNTDHSTPTDSRLSSFADRLAHAVATKRNPVCVGLDPRWKSLPEPIRAGLNGDSWTDQAKAFARFSCAVIDAVADLVPVCKPQAAFFEALGPSGMSALKEVIDHATAAGLEVILDGKRNDIGTTAQAYAEAWLGREQSPWGADSLTVSPYLGDDTLEPMIQVATARQAGLWVLVKTSNPGSAALQDRSTVLTETKEVGPLVREIVASWVERANVASLGACGFGAVGAVVGATYPQELVALRAAMPHAWLLVPGYGAQGGGAADTVGAFDSRGLGAVVNSSRGIIFAHSAPSYAERFSTAAWTDAVRAATLDMITAMRDETPAGNL